MTIIRNLVTSPLGPGAPLTTTGWRGSADALTAVSDEGQPAVRITEGAADTGLYLDPSVNFTAQVGDLIRLDIDVKPQLAAYGDKMRLRIVGYGGAVVAGGDMNQAIPAGVWTRLSVTATVTTAPAGHSFRVLAWPDTFAGSTVGSWIQVRRAVVQIGPSVSAGDFRDGDSPGWVWEGTPHASASTGPDGYAPDGALTVGGDVLDSLDLIADFTETQDSASTVRTTLNAAGIRHHATVTPAGAATGTITAHIVRQTGAGDPGTRAARIAESLATGAPHTLNYFADLAGLAPMTFVPTGRVQRQLEIETVHRRRQAVWTVSCDYTRLGAPATPAPAAPNGVGYVGELTAQSPYRTLTVRGIDDAYDMIGYDITAAGAGKTVVTRLQGRYIDGTPAADALQRIEEITFGSGYQVGTRSNLEIAMQVYPSTAATSGSEFIPYHGTVTATEVRAATYTTLAGADVAMPGIGSSLPLPGGLVISQSLYGKHPAAPANQLRIDLETRFHPDGMIEVRGTVTFLVATKVGSVYAPMTPYVQSDMNRLQHAGGTLTLETATPGTTTNVTLPESITSGVLTSSARPSVRVAWAWTDPAATFRTGKQDRKTSDPVVFVQRRTDGIGKVYRHVWAPDSVVPAGETWQFGAQWRYMEVAP